MNARSLGQLIAPLANRVRLLVGRGVATRVDEGGQLQRVQLRLLRGELRDGLEVLGHYGLTSVPDEGAEAVVLFLGGNRDNGVVVSLDDRRARPTDLARGEVRLYNAAGACVTLKPDGSIELVPGAAGVVRLAGNLEVAGDVEATGDVDAGGDVSAAADVGDGASGNSTTLAGMRAIFNAHVHPENGGAGPTGPPIVPMS